MYKISDEMIMAWVDGEADPVDSQHVETYLKQNPAAAERVARFSRTGRDLARMFDQPMREPVPARLLDMVRNGVRPESRRRPLWSAIVDAVRNASTPMMTTAALASVLVASGFIWNAKSFPPNPASGPVALSAQVQRALDTVASGTSLAIGPVGGSAAVRPVFTFASNAGGFCRQYEETLSSGSGQTGIACRQDNGEWRIEFKTNVVAAPRTGIAPVERMPLQKLEGAIDRLIKGDVLGAKQEEALIARHWRGEK